MASRVENNSATIYITGGLHTTNHNGSSVNLVHDGNNVK